MSRWLHPWAVLLAGALGGVVAPAGAAVGGAAVGGAAPATDAAVVSVGPPGGMPAAERVLCEFDSSELAEVSGLAASVRHPGIVWATNDSGGGPYLYALDTADCRIRATLRLLDTPARDHEALATGRDARGRPVIWVGDIGDNRGTWPYVRIHKVIEPRNLRDRDVEVTTYRFTYPDGPVDAEALLAAPDREQLWVISKEDGVGAEFALPSPMSPAQTPMVATRLVPARSQVTDAAMAPDGTRYVVRDYFSAEVFSGEPPGQAEARFRLPLQPQGEAVTWSQGGQSLLVASERSGALIEVDVPRTALGTDSGVAAVLPRVAGFDIYPYVRIAALVLAVLMGLVLLGRANRRRRRRRSGTRGR